MRALLRVADPFILSEPAMRRLRQEGDGLELHICPDQEEEADVRPFRFQVHPSGLQTLALSRAELIRRANSASDRLRRSRNCVCSARLSTRSRPACRPSNSSSPTRT